MTRTHIIVGGIVTNTIIATVSEAQAANPGATCIDAALGGAIGWTYDGQTLTPPVVPPPAPVIPSSVSKAQGKTALIAAGLWPAVLAAVAAIEDATQRALAEVALHDTTTWERTSPTLNALAYGLGLTDAQLDALFIAASEVSL